MPVTVQSKQAKEHAGAVVKAAEYFAALAKRGELPLTEADFNERVKAFHSKELAFSNALLLAILEDKPCPQSLFGPWASVKTIWLWRKLPENPLPWVKLNDQVMVKPSDFFTALERHGKSSK